MIHLEQILLSTSESHALLTYLEVKISIMRSPPYLPKVQIIAYMEMNRSPYMYHLINERKEFMLETQHTHQTATRTAQNQDKETTGM